MNEQDFGPSRKHIAIRPQPRPETNEALEGEILPPIREVEPRAADPIKVINLEVNPQTIHNTPMDIMFVEQKVERPELPLPETPEGVVLWIVAGILKAAVTAIEEADKRRERRELIEAVAKARGGQITPHSPTHPIRAGVVSQTAQSYSRPSAPR